MRPLLSVISLLLATSCSSGGPLLVASDPPGPTPTAGATPATVPPATEETTATTSPTATPPVPTRTPEPPLTSPPPIEETSEPTQQAEPAPEPDQSCTSGLTGNPTRISEATADFDGDGASDQVTVYATGIAADPWHIRVDTAAGESFDSPMGPDVLAISNVGPIGGADVDGDGTTDELFVVIGAGASTTIVGLFNRVGCEILQATLNGVATGFPIGGSIGNIGGLQCLDTDDNGVNNTVVAWNGSADFAAGEGEYEVEGFEYQLTGIVLEQVATRSLAANISQADFVYGQLTCGSVNF